MNPPFRNDYLNVAIEQLIAKQIKSYIVLPIWPSALWYQSVMQASSVVIIVPDGYKFFSSPDYMTTRSTKNWKIMIVYFAFNHQKKKSYSYNSKKRLLTRL